VLVGGDVITGLDGQSVTSIEQLASSVQQYSPGDEVTLNILRDGRQTELTVTLAERPQ
jgi:putative serine protease PepD